MGIWRIEGLDEPRKCFAKAWQDAAALAHTQDHDVVVRYLGPRDNPNRERKTSDFIAKRDGTFDHRIDPTWWENK
jgi:hypothetical protein